MIISCPSCNARLRFHEKALNPQNATIRCVRCQTEIKVILYPEPSDVIDDTTFMHHTAEVGWCVVHDEFTEIQTVPLRLGKQTMGRYSINKKCDVPLHTQDRYMSRLHLIIEVAQGKDGRYKYWVSEHPDSANPTFIDTYPLKRGTTLELIDGVVMQLGKTKVVLKTAAMAGTAKKATQTVLAEGFAKTVIF
jgi:predicted Zn finger-like uncharacterized protein